MTVCKQSHRRTRSTKERNNDSTQAVTQRNTQSNRITYCTPLETAFNVTPKALGYNCFDALLESIVITIVSLAFIVKYYLTVSKMFIHQNKTTLG